MNIFTEWLDWLLLLSSVKLYLLRVVNSILYFQKIRFLLFVCWEALMSFHYYHYSLFDCWMTFSIGELNRCAFSHLVYFFFLISKYINTLVPVYMCPFDVYWCLFIYLYFILLSLWFSRKKAMSGKILFPMHFPNRNIILFFSSFFFIYIFSFAMPIFVTTHLLPSLSILLNIQKYFLVGMNIKFLNESASLAAACKTDWIFSFYE